MDQQSPAIPEAPTPSSSVKPIRWKSPRCLGLALMCIGVAVGVKTWGVTQETAAPRALLPVSTLSLQPSSFYNIQRSYSGEVQAHRTSELGFELTGTLIDIAVEEGDWVNQGTLLARLDTRMLETQRQQLLAQKAQAQAQFRELKTGPRTEEIGAARAAVEDLGQQLLLAQKQSQRRQNLYKKGAISRESFEERYFAAAALKKTARSSSKTLGRAISRNPSGKSRVPGSPVSRD